jgi:hypothetical protein
VRKDKIAILKKKGGGRRRRYTATFSQLSVLLHMKISRPLDGGGLFLTSKLPIFNAPTLSFLGQQEMWVLRSHCTSTQH